MRWVVGVKGCRVRIPKHPRKYLDISTKYLDIFTIHSVCVSVCVEWERVFEWGEGERVSGGRFTREGKVRENVAVNYCETRNI